VASKDIIEFLGVIDSELTPHANVGETLDLYLLGRAALIIGYGVQLMTKDVDVVHVAGSRLLDIAVNSFGKYGSERQAQQLYLETVASGLPPLPIGYQGRCVDIPGRWQVIRPKLPEAHDLLVTKLRRFHLGDREDVRILCETGSIDGKTLQTRLDLAHTFSDHDDPKVISAAANLQLVLNYLEGRLKSI
jgi:Nucleotidyltransferase of unknown function (DUF6036)